jgi:uncharacterized membrane protein
MEHHNTQDEINKDEWENSDNWSSIYFSKKDSRTCVPKKNPKYGWTINFGSTSGAKWIYYFFIMFFLLGLVLGVFFTSLLY